MVIYSLPPTPLKCSFVNKKKPRSSKPRRGGDGGVVLSEKLGRGVRPASKNPYPIYDRNLRYSLPYLGRDL